MSISAIGGSVGLQYDFTNMTSKQAFDAAKDLESKGVFSAEAAGRLEGAATGVDYATLDRSSSSTAHTLADDTRVNWVQYMQQTSNWCHANAGTIIGNDHTDELLTELKSYGNSAGQSQSTIVISA